MWWKRYETLDTFGGTLKYIGEDLEDMIEISYDDGMFIDIGKSEKTKIYYITVVSSNDKIGWKNPLLELPVYDKMDLYDRIQETIVKFRKI